MLTYKVTLQALSSTIALLVLSLTILHVLGGFEYPLTGPNLEPSGPYKYSYVVSSLMVPYKKAVIVIERPDLIDLVRVYVGGETYINPQGVIDCRGSCLVTVQIVSKKPTPLTVLIVKAYTDHVKPLVVVFAIATLIVSALALVVRRGGGVRSLG